MGDPPLPPGVLTLPPGLDREQTAIPSDALDLVDFTVEIPIIGTGTSLNVAVAGSLVLYRLAGLL